MLGLFPKGVETLPDALLGAGLAQRIAARCAGRVEPPAYDPRRDEAIGLHNPQAIAEYSRTLAGAVEAVRARGEFPVVLGGAFGGHLVSDFYAGYNRLPGPHQRCWAHLLRDLHALKVQPGQPCGCGSGPGRWMPPTAWPPSAWRRRRR